MVAYNFKTAFHDDIRAYRKLQTVRHAGKRRHARPGEPIQLYGGLRTKNAAKLIPDPMCVGVDQIVIPVGTAFVHRVGQVEINGIPLTEAQMHDFAIADGFRSLEQFGRFWFSTHGAGLFEGVVIRWAPNAAIGGEKVK